MLPADVNIVNNALGSLLQGPTEAEQQAGLSTAIPALSKVRGTALMGDVAVVNLSGSFSALGPQASPQLRLAQIVYTVTVFPVRVLFQIDGQPARAIGGFILPDRPLTRDDFADWAPPILLESVGPQEVLTPATVDQRLHRGRRHRGRGTGHRRRRPGPVRRHHPLGPGSWRAAPVHDLGSPPGGVAGPGHPDHLRGHARPGRDAAGADHPGPAGLAPIPFS